MRICINNLLESATLTPENPNAGFPIENLFSNSLIERAQFDNQVVIDLGSAKKITALAFANAVGPVTIEANSSDSWGAPAFSLLLTGPVAFIDETYRYWRISVTTVAFRLGYFYLGQFLQMPDTDGEHEPQSTKNDIKDQTSGGSIFPTAGIVIKNEEVNFPLVYDSERTAFLNWWESSDSALNHFIVRFEDALAKYVPYFGNVLEQNFEREFQNYNYSIEIREAK